MATELISTEEEAEMDRRLAWSTPADFATVASRGRWRLAAHLELLNRKLLAIASGTIRRLIVTMPPRHGKSELCSKYFPAWYVATHPENQIILCSYEAGFASSWGGKARDLLEEYGHLFGVQVRTDIRAREAWQLSGHEGTMRCAGAGGPITGKGSHVMIIDDPVKNSEQADSKIYREKVWDWWKSTAYTRLEPDASVMVIQCMVGGTLVLMADGTERALRDIRAGDAIATYRNGRIASSVVLKWANNGPDRVFTINMKSGITVTANERHPFLVRCDDGSTEWRKLCNLKPGDDILRVIGGSTVGLSVHSKGATGQPFAKDTASRITIKRDGKNTGQSSRHRMESALSASNCREQMCERIGAENSVSITTMPREKSVGCCAMTATAWSDTQRRQKSCSTPLDTYRIIPDSITEITESGHEDVFDIQVAETENFIANGLVSHNTRWHTDDLAGRLLAEQRGEDAEGGDDPGEERWETINLPAIAEENDALGRAPGEALWPERWPIDALERRRKRISAFKGARFWFALYQQRPLPPGGAVFNRDDFTSYEKAGEIYRLKRRNLTTWTVKASDLRIFLTVDAAASEAATADYTVVQVWGLTPSYDLLLLDQWRQQASSPRVVDQIVKMRREWDAEFAGVERDGIGLPVVQTLRTKGVTVKPIKARGDKVQRSTAAQLRMAAGMVHFPDASPWLADLCAELESFPLGAHDDQADALSYACAIAQQLGGAIRDASDDAAEAKELAVETDSEEAEQSHGAKIEPRDDDPVPEMSDEEWLK